jgi:hypothetical protein
MEVKLLSFQRAVIISISGLIHGNRRVESPSASGITGLYHTAIIYPDRASLGNALKRIVEAVITIDGAADHGGALKLFTSATLMKTALSFIETVKKKTDQETQMVSLLCLTSR